MQSVAECCGVLQRVAVCCSESKGASYNVAAKKAPIDLEILPVCLMLCVTVCCSVLQCVAVCCSVLQCIAVCCSVLQCDTK